MLGEGMPWHIIIPFFVFGILLGINAGKKDRNGEEEQNRAGE